MGPAAGEAAARALLRLLRETRSWRPHAALLKLGETSVAVPIPELANVDDRNPRDDDPCVGLLIGLGAEAVPALVNEFTAGRSLAAVRLILHRIGAAAVPPLVEATRSDAPGVRLTALRGLVTVDALAKEHLTAIDAAIEAARDGDPDPEVREAATKAVNELAAQRARIWPNGRPTR